ncbi:hypothetical protein D3C84_1205190 [compost metagenome]
MHALQRLQQLFRLLIGSAKQYFQKPMNRGQRGAQLMRSIRYETAHLLLGFFFRLERYL